MLTSVGRAAAGRLLTARISSTAVSSPVLASQLLRSAGRPVLARGFAVSSRAYQPAAAAAAAAVGKKKSASAKPKTKTAASKAKAPKAKAPKAKADAADKKPAARKPKVEVDPETQTRRDIRDNKKQALYRGEPTRLPESPWVVYLIGEIKGKSIGGSELAEKMRAHGVEFRSMPAYKIEEFKATGEANKKTNEANYKQWVESHPVERIYLANLARKRLGRLMNKPVTAIRDERQSRRPPGAYTLFVKARYSALGGSHDAVARMKELAVEWKGLPQSDRQSFIDLAAGDIAKYKAEGDAIRARASELHAQDERDKKMDVMRKKERKQQLARERRAILRAAPQ